MSKIIYGCACWIFLVFIGCTPPPSDPLHSTPPGPTGENTSNSSISQIVENDTADQTNLQSTNFAIEAHKLLVAAVRRGEDGSFEMDTGIQRIESIAMSQDNKWLAIAGQNVRFRSEVHAFTLPFGGEAFALRASEEIAGGKFFVGEIKFSADSRSLFMATTAGIQLWQMADFQGQSLDGNGPSKRTTHLSTTISFDLNTSLIVTASPLELRKLGSRSLVWSTKDESSLGARGVALSPDNALIATAHLDNRIRLWNASSAQKLSEIHGLRGVLHSAAFCPKGNLLAVGGEGGLGLWELKHVNDDWKFDDVFVAGFPSHVVVNIKFTPNGEYLATSGKLATLWDVASRRQLMVLSRQNELCFVAFSADSKSVVIAKGNRIEIHPLSKLLEQTNLDSIARRAAEDVINGVKKNDGQMFQFGLLGIGPQSMAAIPVLVQAMSDPSIEVRSKAAFAVSRIGPAAAQALPALVRLLTDDAPEVRQAAARSIPAVDSNYTLPDISKAPVPKVQSRGGTFYFEGRSFEEWLSMLGEADDENYRPTIAIRTIGHQAIPNIMTALGSEAIQLRLGAANALGIFASEAEDATAPLTQLLGNEKLIAVVSRTLARIAKAKGQPVPNILVDKLTAPNLVNRLSIAVSILKSYPSNEIARNVFLDAITEGVNLPESGDERFTLAETSSTAIYTVSHLGPTGEFAVEAIAKILQSPDQSGWSNDDHLRVMAAYALGIFGNGASSAVPALLAGLRDPESKVRDECFRVLPLVVPGKIPPQLLDVIKESNFEIRRAAIWTLSRFGKPAVPHLIEILESNDPMDQLEAIRALLNVQEGVEAALPSLRKMTEKDRSEQVRSEAEALINYITRSQTQPR